MLKVCLITTNLLPVPNVLGGAIESLVTNLIKEQEKNAKIDLTIVSIYNKEAQIESKKYQKTNFIYIKKNLKYIFFGIIYNLSNKLFKTNFNTYNHMVLSKIKHHQYDFILAEGGHYESYYNFLKYYNRNQLILHLHHQGSSNEIIDKTFSRVLGVSDFVTYDFANTSNGIEPYCLRNGIRLDNFDIEVTDKEKVEIRDKYGLTKDDFIVLFCGRLIKEKGVLELIKSIKRIDNKNIKLLILGNNPFLKESKDEYIEKLNKEVLNYEDRIIFTGYVNNYDVYKYYKTADIVCIPSVWEDAATLVCVEAMVCKKPVLATKSGGIPEHLESYSSIIVEKEKKLVENLEKGILKFYKNKDNLEKIGLKGYEHGCQFNSHNMYLNLVKYLKVFDKENKKECEKNEV